MEGLSTFICLDDCLVLLGDPLSEIMDIIFSSPDTPLTIHRNVESQFIFRVI